MRRCYNNSDSIDVYNALSDERAFDFFDRLYYSIFKNLSILGGGQNLFGKEGGRMELITSPYFLLLTAIVLGQFIGKIDYKNFSLGSSGSLFAGLLLSYLHYQYIKGTGKGLDSDYILVSKQLFGISLIGFIASVGLLAGPNIEKALRQNGIKFLILSLVVTFTGAVSTFLLGELASISSKASLIGTYVGALTSSPGLATALEAGKVFASQGEALIGLGYSVAYVPGVVLVIIFVQGQRQLLKQGTISSDARADNHHIQKNQVPFSVKNFAFVTLLGVIIGNIQVPMGASIGTFSLGKTGGVLMSALYFGHRGRCLGMSFNLDPNTLKGIRDISLNIFLAIVGLNYGYQVISLGKSAGVMLLIAGIITGGLSILVGYLVGSKILVIERIPLIGGLCGAMTSTPGLASAIESIDSDEITVYYGATYPFALLFMILFTNILSTLAI